MEEHRVYILVLLVLVGGLVLDIIPKVIFDSIDTHIGRTVGLLLIVSTGFLLGIPEAILLGSIFSLMIDRAHDDKLVHHKNTKFGEGSRVLYDNSSTYTQSMIRRLGLVPFGQHS